MKRWLGFLVTLTLLLLSLPVPVTPVAAAGGNLTINGTSGDDTIYITVVSGKFCKNGVTTGVTAGTSSVITINALAGNDTIDISALTTAQYASSTLTGGLGIDLIKGGPKVDTIQGDTATPDANDGNDTIYGYSGNDVIYGGGGNDIIFGGGGNDNIQGQDGDDNISGDINGGTGGDSLYGGTGCDWIYGGYGSVPTGWQTDLNQRTLAKFKENRTTTDPNGIDTIEGNAGDDYVDSGGGNDILIGEVECTDLPSNCTYTVTIVGQGTANGGTVPNGTLVNITATPADGWGLYSWSEDATGRENPLPLLVTSDKNITATFISLDLFPELEFHSDYVAGTTDIYGNFMGGTECTWLVGHQEMLFAAIGYWNDDPGSDPEYGSQVLRKETPDGPWLVEQNWNSDYIAIKAMESITFTKDGDGNPLVPPVNLLLCSTATETLVAGDHDIEIWVRDDSENPPIRWQSTLVWTEHNTTLAYARAISQVYQDKDTLGESVFVGTSRGYGAQNGRIFRGVYDDSVIGCIRWDEVYEFSGPGRVGAFAEVNGRLYASQQENIQNPAAAGIYVRNDGENPSWEPVYHLPTDAPGFQYSLMRGLAAVDDPLGGEHQVLVGAWDASGGLIQRIDPEDDHSVTTELDGKQYLKDEWGGLYAEGLAYFAAYNHITPVQHPLTGETVHLLGLLAWHPDPELRLSSWYFVRYQDGSYGLGRIWAPDYPMSEEMIAANGLRGARTTIVSPFPEDNGEVFYFGGFDCWTVQHNTAWIFKATVKTQP